MIPSFERSPLVDQLVKLLQTVNQDASYEALSQQTGVSIARIKAALGSARRIVQKQKIEFAIQRGVGIKRLDDNGIANQSNDHRKRLGRAGKRYARNLDSIQDFSALPPDKQIEVTTNRTIFNLTRMNSATPPAQKQTPADKPVQPDIPNLVALATRK